MIFWMYKIVEVEINFDEDEFLIACLAARAYSNEAYVVQIAYLSAHAPATRVSRSSYLSRSTRL